MVIDLLPFSLSGNTKKEVFRIKKGPILEILVGKNRPDFGEISKTVDKNIHSLLSIVIKCYGFFRKILVKRETEQENSTV